MERIKFKTIVLLVKAFKTNRMLNTKRLTRLKKARKTD